jgi:hypothetical protein
VANNAFSGYATPVHLAGRAQSPPGLRYNVEESDFVSLRPMQDLRANNRAQDPRETGQSDFSEKDVR